ncbi:hypothetical protein cypCar_00018682 [Cyprinus carpio]|nr:hypothetical protein cypCar_00018682 [Cyprinus carpio]
MVGIKRTDLPPTAAIKFFGAGTAACFADLVTFPLDTAKVRLQIQGESTAASGSAVVKYRGVFGTIATMVRTEGARSLYNGLVAGLQRQMSFASVRIGLYDSMKQFYNRGSESCMPNITRNAIVNCAELVTYDIIKELILKYDLMTDNLPCHFTAAFGAGFCTTIVASPVDVVKTRFMNSTAGQYSSALNCALTMLTKEGPKAFYKGFVPSFLRLGSWNIVMFVSYEQIKRATVKFIGAGTAACIADLFTFPLDTAKVRLQIQGESKSPVNTGHGPVKYRGVFGTISTMVRVEGPRSLYSGLVAGLQHVGIGSRLMAGCTTGAMAVALAQPTDVVKVRFQAQNSAGANKRYHGTMDAYRTIAKEEGFRDDLPCHFTSAFGAGFCTTVIASPVDVVKTRYMNSAPGQYSSALNCAVAMLTKEGPKAFYKGFMPSFLRLGSWNVVMFVTYEQLKRAMMAARHNWATPL